MTCLRDGEYTRQKNAVTKRCEVNIDGVTTKYVAQEDYDRAVQNAGTAALAADIREKGLQHELAKVKGETDWQWYQDHIEAMTQRFQAELDMYHKTAACTCCSVHVRPMQDVGGLTPPRPMTHQRCRS